MKVKVRVGDYHSHKSESATTKCVSGCKRVGDYLSNRLESERAKYEWSQEGSGLSLSLTTNMKVRVPNIFWHRNFECY